MGYGPWGRKELDTTERLTHTLYYLHGSQKISNTLDVKIG